MTSHVAGRNVTPLLLRRAQLLRMYAVPSGILILIACIHTYVQYKTVSLSISGAPVHAPHPFSLPYIFK